MDRVKSFQIPSLFEIHSSAEFFHEFLALNSGKRGFSQRAIAKLLNWPVSYIPDVMKGRKKLTLKRVLEFARYFRLDPIDMEKLILLSIEDLGLARPTEVASIRRLKSKAREAATADFSLLDAKLLLVFEAVRWLKGTGTPERVGRLIERQRLSAEELESYIKTLIEKGWIAQDGPHLRAVREFAFSDDLGIVDDTKLHLQFGDFFSTYLNSKIGPALFNSSIVHINRIRFEEIADRIVAFRNWIHSISALDEKLPFGKADVRLFQLDLNLTPLISKETAHELRPQAGK